MMWEGFRHIETGEIQVFPAGAAIILPQPEWESIAIPEGWPDAWEVVDGAFIPRRPKLPVEQFRLLITSDEWVAVSAAKLSAETPLGIRAQIDALAQALAMKQEISADEPLLAPSLALFVGLGILSEQRAAEVLAFLPPGALSE